MAERLPCRVSADLARHLHAQELAERFPIEFDEFDDDMVKAVAGERLAKPIQALLLTLRQIEQTEGSFGSDAAKVRAALIPDLQALREACKDQWKDC